MSFSVYENALVPADRMPPVTQLLSASDVAICPVLNNSHHFGVVRWMPCEASTVLESHPEHLTPFYRSHISKHKRPFQYEVEGYADKTAGLATKDKLQQNNQDHKRRSGGTTSRIDETYPECCTPAVASIVSEVKGNCPDDIRYNRTAAAPPIISANDTEASSRIGESYQEYRTSAVASIISEVKDNYSHDIKYNRTLAAPSIISANDTEASSRIDDSYPEYYTTSIIDELRATEYAYLDEQDHVYLDYTGSGLAADAQHRAHKERLASTLYGNPHSVNPTSDAATQLIEQTRARVLAHLNASPDEYTVIFTPNATGAARLVGEAYPFSRRTKLVMSTDNHNSVKDLGEYARRGHSRVVYVPTEAPDLRINPAVLFSKLTRRSGWDMLGTGRDSRRGLFAYPAQSNFSGVRHPLSWVRMAQALGYDVLLDTAAYLPTGTIDLSRVKPEFLLVSWYKLFGYPMGVGCLVARRSALARLSRPWFSGGTIKAVAVAIPSNEMATDESAFEGGTLNFLSITDIMFGLGWLAKIGMDVIQTRVRCLTGWFLDRLKRLEHSDGRPMIRIYGPIDTKARGGAVTFNFLDVDGDLIDERLVAIESAAARISLRTGCFRNPRVAENAMSLIAKRLRPLYHTKTKNVDGMIRVIGLPSGGAIRVSFGIASNTADVDRFFDFAIKTYRDRENTAVGLPPRDRC